MIVANMSTFPARVDTLRYVLEQVAPQFDRINLVLNQFDAVPDFVSGLRSVFPIVPDTDTKDTGKFLPDTTGAEYVFLLDDDMIFPPDYVERSLALMQRYSNGRRVFSYHGLLYDRARLGISPKTWRDRFAPRETDVFRFRRILDHALPLDSATVVDEIGTGASIFPRGLLPSFAYVKDAQRFVDVRVSVYCRERGLTPVCLPHELNWIKEIRYLGSIFDTYSKALHPHVAKEIKSYAFKVSGRGEAVPAEGD